MWFYIGIFATMIRLQQKLSLKSELQNRPTNLIPVHGKYKYEWSPTHEKAPSFGYLELACKTSIQFAARREHWFDRWSKQIGLAYECQTGHNDLDQHIYLTGITENDADFIGQHAQLPKQILAILSKNKRDPFINPGNQLICDGEHFHRRKVRITATISTCATGKTPGIATFLESTFSTQYCNYPGHQLHHCSIRGIRVYPLLSFPG
ncbi:hypothetical protein [Methylophilus sp.]|uniref:hypothetical protein n=1 Tax=Methylophilus sp. TaxID=29541 RepID=UPI0040380C50